MRKKFKVSALVILLLIAAFVRLFHIDQYMQFQGDEGRDSLVLWHMAVDKKFTLIGPGTSIGNMYNGPLYYYLVLPSFVLSGLSPVGPSAFVALIGVVTVLLVYLIGQEWFSPIVGSTAAVLYALSPTVIIYSRSSWNPNVMPFFALLVVYSLWRFCQKQRPLWLVPMSVGLAFAIQSHYLALLLVPTIVVWFFVAWRYSPVRSQKNFRTSVIWALLSFFILMSPLVFFDLRHNFLNTRAMWAFFAQRQTTVNLKVYKALPQIFPLVSQIETTLLGSGVQQLGLVTAIVSLAGSVILVIKNRRNQALLILLTWIISGLVGLGLYKQHIYDHYFGFFFPAYFILFGAVIGYFANKNLLFRVIAGGSVIGLAFAAILRNPLWNSPNSLYQKTQAVADQIITLSGGKPFNLGMIAKQNYDAGYRFVLTAQHAQLKGIPPNITDQLFVVCEDKVNDCHPVGHPQAEIANFGWAKIDQTRYFLWGTTLFRLVHNVSR